MLCMYTMYFDHALPTLCGFVVYKICIYFIKCSPKYSIFVNDTVNWSFCINFQIVYHFIIKIDFIFDYGYGGVLREGVVPVVPADSRTGPCITWD